jgi:hypothetical protein
MSKPERRPQRFSSKPDDMLRRMLSARPHPQQKKNAAKKRQKSAK